MKKQIALIAVKYGLGLGLLTCVICSYWSRTVDGQEVGIAGVLERPVRPGFLIVAAIACCASVLLTFVRWFILVRAQGIPLRLPGALRLGLVGYYYNTFLPGAVGGDIIKAACLAWEQSRRTVAVATVIVDRVIGLCGLFWLAALFGGICWATGILTAIAQGQGAVTIVETIVLGAVAVSAGTLMFWILLGLFSDRAALLVANQLERVPRVGHALAELWRAVRLYRCRGRAVALTLVMAMVSHSLCVVTFYCAARGLFPAAEVPSFAGHYLIIPAGALVKGFFPAPGGVGGGEYGFGKLYELIHFSFAAGVLASLAQRVIEWSLGLVGYAIYLGLRPRQESPASKESQMAAAA
jgi:glycosyltransferase 2 family protein